MKLYQDITSYLAHWQFSILVFQGLTWDMLSLLCKPASATGRGFSIAIAQLLTLLPITV